MYQDLFNKAKNIKKQEACMKFYDASRSLYLETDASGVSLRAELMLVREEQNCGHENARQCDPASNCICQEQLVRCRVAEKQH